MEYNENQKLAVEEIKSHLALGAGAGTGKTAVLTGRYLNILKNGTLSKGRETEEILAITFTNKAADEMLGKIIKSLSESGMGDYLEKGRFNISTIHSFCEKILRQYSLLLGIQSDFEILSEEQKAELQNKACDLVLKEFADNYDLKELVRDLDLSRPHMLKKEIISLYERLRNQGYEIDEGVALTQIKGKIDKGNLLSLLSDFENEKSIKKFKTFTEDPLYDEITSGNFTLENITALLKNLGTSQKAIRYEIEEECENILAELEDVGGPKYKLIQDLLESYDKNFEQVKEEENSLDFDDLQIKTLKLLEIESVRKKLQKEISYIMIDEFQDINRTQRKLFMKLTDDLTAEINFFVVGDEKQSIYGFRGSDVREYYKVVEKIKNTSGNELNLVDNYRTSANLLEDINKVFDFLFENYTALTPHVKESEAPFKVLQFEVEGEDAQSIALKEAEAVANFVQNSQYKYEDIGIIFRSGANMELIGKELEKRNIPFNISRDKKLVDTVEVQNIVNLLKTLITDERAGLASYLLEFIGLSKNTVYYYFKNDGPEDADIESEEKELLINSLKLFEEFKFISKHFDPYTLVKEIVTKTGCLDNLAKEDRGAEKVRTVKEFMKLTYKESKGKNLKEFVDLLMNMEELVSDEAGRGVNLLTIHGSKGLEYELLIIPESYKAPTGKDTDKINFSKYHGFGINGKYNGRFLRNKRINKVLSDEEELRIFYVAMTRAKKECVLTLPLSEKYPKTFSYLNMVEAAKVEGKRVVAEEVVRETSFEDEAEKETKPSIKFKDRNFYTVTQYMNYLNRDKTFERREKKEILKISPGVFGTIIHKFISTYTGENRDAHLENILNSYGIDLEMKNMFTKQINNYTEKYYFNGKCEREYEVNIKLDYVNFMGIVDEIRFIDDKIQVIDYKSNSQGSVEELVEHYEPQIKLYAYALSKIFNKKVTGKIIFLAKDRECLIDCSDSAIATEIENFKKYCKGLQN